MEMFFVLVKISRVKLTLKNGENKKPWLANICLLSGFHTCITFFGMIYLRKPPEDWFFLGMGFW